MRHLAIVLACLACASHGQESENLSREGTDPVQALATLLLASDRGAAFNPSSVLASPAAGVNRHGTGAVMGPPVDLLGRPMPMEFWTEPQKRRHEKKIKEAIKDPRDMTPEEMQECLEAMTLNNLKPCPGSKKKRMRKGRGHGSGKGKTCGYGNRGQKSRSGKTKPFEGFEGGQTPLYRRLPKYVGRSAGFTGHKKEIYTLIKLDHLQKCHDGEEIDYLRLYRRRLVSRENKRRYIYKVLGNGKETFDKKNLVVKAHAFSLDAKNAIESNGGKCIFLSKTSGKEIPMPYKYTEEGIEKRTAAKEKQYYIPRRR